MTTLSAVKGYLQAHRRATLLDISIALEAQPEAVHGLLEIWRGKNRVRLLEPACGGCGKSRFGGCNCGDAHLLAPEIWEWTEESHGA